jgi:subtilisin family serine protease
MTRNRNFMLISLVFVCLFSNVFGDTMRVVPEEGFVSSGVPTGPFTPSSKQYQITNGDANTIWWGVSVTAGWLSVSPAWGSLDPNAETTITVSLTADANSLSEGVYTDTVTFLNITSGQEQTRAVTLTIAIPEGMSVSPQAYDVNLVEGTSLKKIMTIENGGADVFDYYIQAKSIAVSSVAAERIEKITAAAEEQKIFSIADGRDFTNAGDMPYKEGELLVRFSEYSSDKKINKRSKSQILSSLGGGDIKRHFKLVPGLTRVKLPAGMTVEQALKKFNNTDGIVYAQPNYKVKILSTIPNDTRFGELWGMRNTGQSGGTAGADIKAYQAWDITTGSRDIVVAVIDTGVDYTHPDLAANMWVNPGEIAGNGIDDDGNGFVDDVYGYDFCNDDGDPMDDNNHGTHCAGIIGAVGNNSLGVVGVCWKVKIMAVKFISFAGEGSTSDAIEAIEYSTLMGANLTSNSWSGGAYDQSMKDAIDAAGAAGMLFVAAAGNDGTNNDIAPSYPSSFDCNNIIAVASTDRYDHKASFSNYGLTTVDLGAPGSSILSCQPGSKYQYLSGTSMAAPHVAGACALVWSLNPTLSNSEVKDIILGSVDPIDALSGKCVSGGRLNVYSVLLNTKLPWIRFEPENGSVNPGQISDVNVVFDANGISPGAYNAEIVITTNDPYHPSFVVPVTMTVKPEPLVISPEAAFKIQGVRGGPFEPNCEKYTLTNIGAEDVNWTAICDVNWLAIQPAEGVLEPNQTVEVNVCLSGQTYLLDPNLYTGQIRFDNLSVGTFQKRDVSLTVEAPDSFTELFEGTSVDLSDLMLTFTPDGSNAYYEACRDEVTGFSTDPAGGVYVSIWDDDSVEVILNDNAKVLFYGLWYDRFYIGSNGYITFGQPDVGFEPDYDNHFALPRISALFTDLNPSDEYCVSYKQLADRVAVTFENVPLYGSKNAKNSFQIEMFFVSGQIRVSWLEVAQAEAIAGLSEGKGLPAALFEKSDLSEYPACWLSGDFNRDYVVDFVDLAIFIQHWLESDCTIPDWCGGSDLDFSDTVSENDLAIFSGNWLQSF